jgi:hypothetical protein
MRNYTVPTLLLLTLALAGCGDETARQYAAQLAEILKSYEAKIDKQMAAQETTYTALAKDLDDAEQRDTSGGQDSERLERELVLRDQLTDPDARRRITMNSTRLRNLISSYVEQDAKLHREQITAEFDAYKRFLASLQDLSQETENVAQLSHMLADLSEKKGVMTRMIELKQFGDQVKQNYDKLKCDGAKAEETRLTAEVAGLTAKAGAAAKPDDKTALTSAVTKAQADLTAVQTQKNAIANCK